MSHSVQLLTLPTPKHSVIIIKVRHNRHGLANRHVSLAWHGYRTADHLARLATSPPLNASLVLIYRKQLAHVLISIVHNYNPLWRWYT